MDVFRNRGSFLLTQFREFYREVVRLKRTVEFAAPTDNSNDDPDSGGGADAGLGALADVLGASMASGSEASAPGGTVTMVATAVQKQTGGGDVVVRAHGNVHSVWQPLLSLMERQAIEAGEAGGSFAFEVYREAQYVMAALADEIFLHLEWEGREEWPLLETRLFQTHYAGEELFNRLDVLLQRDDPFYSDLASVYFLALSLGFKGKYRGVRSNRLASYRQQLFALIYRRSPKLFSSNAPLFPLGYQNVMEDLAIRKLPSHWVWLWLITGVLVIWVAVSQYAWSSATSSISCLMCNLLGRGCVCDTGARQPAASQANSPAAAPAKPSKGSSLPSPFERDSK